MSHEFWVPLKYRREKEERRKHTVSGSVPGTLTHFSPRSFRRHVKEKGPDYTVEVKESLANLVQTENTR